MLTDRADGFETFSLAWVAQSTDLVTPGDPGGHGLADVACRRSKPGASENHSLTVRSDGPSVVTLNPITNTATVKPGGTK